MNVSVPTYKLRPMYLGLIPLIIEDVEPYLSIYLVSDVTIGYIVTRAPPVGLGVQLLGGMRTSLSKSSKVNLTTLSGDIPTHIWPFQTEQIEQNLV